MDGRGLTNVVRTLTARYGSVTAALPDAALLRRFAAGRDADAFAELHRRHGPLVWAACRSLHSTPADAEDAYQATFLALVQSAPKVRNPAAVGAWLHAVAVRVGLKLRQRAARRRAREERAARPEADRPVADGSWERLLAAVHEEVDQLPASLRVAFVLCDLQGVPQPDAARRLGWPLGSLSGRLSKARTRLAGRLSARGVAPSAAVGVLGVAATGSEAGIVPVSLASVVRAFAVSPGTAPAEVQALVTEVTTMTHLKWAVAAVLAAGVATLGAGTVLMPTAGGQPPGAIPSEAPPAGVSASPFAIVSDTAVHLVASRYRYVPLDAGQTAESLAATVKRLESQATQGWEFCGSVDMQLTAGELSALRAGHAAAATEATKGKRATHRVLVFKRPAAPAAAAVKPATGLADPAAAPISPEGMPPPGLADPATPPLGRGLTAPAFAPPTGPDAVPPAGGAADPIGADGVPLPKAAAVGPATVIYRAKVAAAETLEKVAVDLAKAGRRGAVTAIADPRTASLILTGEAKAIKEVVERLEALEADLGRSNPRLGPRR